MLFPPSVQINQVLFMSLTNIHKVVWKPVHYCSLDILRACINSLMLKWLTPSHDSIALRTFAGSVEHLQLQEFFCESVILYIGCMPTIPTNQYDHVRSPFSRQQRL